MRGLAIALGALFGLGWIPLFVNRAEHLPDALPYYSPAERFWVFAAPALLGLHVTLACLLLSFVTPLTLGRTLLGLLLFGGALLFWFRARAQIGAYDRRPLPDDPPATLRRDGPFGLVRNPLYFAYLLAAAAPALVAGRPFLVLTWLACFVALAVRATQEERRLHAQLGPAYADYCRAVKRLVPFVW
ncbi:MAG: methyltransferase [Deltaproteobacteria bacterium]|nr:methyltransferase [Deltaproteobacteria bacterium]